MSISIDIKKTFSILEIEILHSILKQKRNELVLTVEKNIYDELAIKLYGILQDYKHTNKIEQEYV